MNRCKLHGARSVLKTITLIAMHSNNIHRRRFLRELSAGLAFPLIAPSLGRAQSTAANSKVQHACIGVGGMMGGTDLSNFRSHAGTEIVAICDVDASILETAGKLVPNARRYRDWREMLATEGKHIDSLNITVPDHMHAPIAMTAMRAGIHVYCQKPMCHDVAEVRALTLAAAKDGLVTQLGTQHASGIGDRMAVEMLKSGAIGRIRHVYLCSNRPGAEIYRLAGPRPAPQQAPAHLDWDKWLGTAPARDYADGAYHPSQWRSWQDFGTGWSGDIGCHIFDAAWRALDLHAPKSVKARVQESWKQSPARRAETWPQCNHITWVFPGNEWIEGGELVVEWFDGEFFPPEEIRKMHPGDFPGEAAMFIGTEGALLLPHRSGPRLYPQEKFASLQRPKLPPRNHYHHFLDAAAGKTKTESHFGQTGPMTEAILLGTVAARKPDTELMWDAAELKFTNHPDADRLLRRSYRSGWSVEELG
jgi:predicted dehydrogenase